MPTSAGAARTAPARAWSPWWAVVLALVGLASLGVPLFYSLLWVSLDQEGMGAVGAFLGHVGRRGLLAGVAVAAPWLVFLARGGVGLFGLGLGATLGLWGWIVWS